MKSFSYRSLFYIAILAIGAVRTVQAQAPAQPPRGLPKTTLAGGRQATANDLRRRLTEPGAGALPLEAGGNPPAVARAALRAFHTAIAEIASRHTCSRRWLNGEELPPRLRQAGGNIPRMARNFS